MAGEREAWDLIWDELMNNHGWVLDSENLVGDAGFDAEDILAEFAPVVEASIPSIGEEVEVTTSLLELGASDVPGVQEEEEDDVLSVIAVRKIVAYQEVDRRLFRK